MNNLPTLSDADLVPESYQMRLMMWRDEFTRGYFEIGDMANEIVLMNIQTGMTIEHSSIYSAVGRFCGKSGRTVRDYAEIAAFFPEETRKSYDMLPFSHFRFAKSCGIKWEEVLEYSMLHPDASESKLSSEFSVAVPPTYVAPTVALKDETCVAPTVAPSVAPTVAVPSLKSVYALASLISQTEKVLSSWDMKKDTRRKLMLALDGLKDVLRDLSEDELPLKYDYDTSEAHQYWSS